MKLRLLLASLAVICRPRRRGISLPFTPMPTGQAGPPFRPPPSTPPKDYMNTPSPAEQRGTKPTQASAHLANATTRDYTDTAREFVDKLNLAEQPATASLPKAHMPVTSIMLLGNARDIQETRARDYDQPGGERSMEATVQAFNIITRRSGELALTESEGWLLMQILKDVRDRSTARPHRDSLEDGISYSSLKAEARLRENQGEM